MIVDVLENAFRYMTLHRGFAQAFAFLGRTDLKELAPGTYAIDGERVFAMVAREAGRRQEDGLLETHERYIDIQLILAGADTMGWRPKSRCRQAAGDYDPDTDIQFFTDPPEAWLPVHNGTFAIFFPEDAHLPLISPGQIHKVVVKVAVNQS
jgi:YhcH/YjgK/YiaL family protein